MCLFGDRKRERSKQEYAYYKDRISGLEKDRQDLLNLLETVQGNTNIRDDENAQIFEMLKRFSTKSSNSATETIEGSTSTASTAHLTAQGGTDRPGEHEMTSDVASPAGSGQLTRAVNLDSGKGLSGFIGNISEVSWLYRAWQRCSGQENVRRHEADSDTMLTQILLDTTATLSAEAFVYLMDEEDLLAVEEDSVDPLQLPSFEMSTLLSEAYFQSSVGTFCFIDRAAFFRELSRYLGGQDTLLSGAGHKWLMKANVVWACGAKWLQTSQIPRSTDYGSHLVYYARARALGFDHRIPLDHPDLDMVEAIGVLAFYLMANGSFSKAWNALGHALRLATALGLHLKVYSMSVRDRERRAETWFSLQNFEVLLSELSGRPKCVDMNEATVYCEPHTPPEAERNETIEQASTHWQIFITNLRSNYDQAESENDRLVWSSLLFSDSETSRLCFKAQSDLCKISGEIRLLLYCRTENVTWQKFQSITRGLQKQLAQWQADLPQALQFGAAQPSRLTSRFQLQLFLYFTSLQMILWHPCLCQVHILRESRQSQQFDGEAARACIQAALSMIQVLPASRAAPGASGIFPWWLMLHYTCQALAVLLIELSLKAPHCTSSEFQRVKTGISKAFAHLRLLSGRSKSAFRCWQLCQYLLGMGMERCRLLVTDMPSEIFAPQTWSREDQDSLEHDLQVLTRNQGSMEM